MLELVNPGRSVMVKSRTPLNHVGQRANLGEQRSRGDGKGARLRRYRGRYENKNLRSKLSEGLLLVDRRAESVEWVKALLRKI